MGPEDNLILMAGMDNVPVQDIEAAIDMLESEVAAAEEAQRKAEQERIDVLARIASSVEGKLTSRMGFRKSKEAEWLEQLRLYLGSLSSNTTITGDNPFGDIQDPASLRRPEVNIVRNKCEMAIDQTIAYQFASGDKNWAIQPPANMEMDNEDLQQTIAVAQEQGQMISTPEEAALFRAGLMEQEIEYHLDCTNYALEARKAIRDRVIIGTGVMKGPINISEMKKYYAKQRTSDGNVIRVPAYREEKYPCVYRVNPWYFFPDDSVVSPEDCEDSIEIHPLSKTELTLLAKNSGYFADQIALCLDEEPRTYSNSPFNDPAYLTQGVNLLKNKYVVSEYHGPLCRSDLETVGINPPEEGEDFYAEVWVCNNRVIRLELSNIEGSQRIPYCISVWEPDPASVFGFGIPLLARDQQRVVIETWKMLLDNAGVSAGPQVVVDTSIIKPAEGGLECTPWKVWYLTEYGADASKAIQFFTPQNSFEGLSALFSMAKQLADEESSVNLLAAGLNLPTGSGGAPAGATQTAIINQNATAPLFARSEEWDDQITRPLLQMVVDWEMQYNPKDEIKGNYKLDVRTSTSYLRSSQEQQKLDRLAQEIASGSPIAKWINMDEFTIARIAGMKLPYRGIVKSPQQVAQEEQNAPPPPPDPNMIKAQAEMAKVENDKARLELDKQKLQVEANQKFQEAQMEYQAQQRTDLVRMKEAEASVLKAQFDFQSNMAAVASKDEQARAKILADLNKSESQLQTQRFLAGMQGQMKAKELAQRDEELKLKRQGKTGI
jgi:hypothetical protein